MDLEERVRELAAAIVGGQPEPFLSERFTCNIDGDRGDHAKAIAWLAATPNQQLQVRVVSIKRNLTFVDWAWPGVGAGVAVLSWNQDGRLVDALVQRRLKV